ncbi:hypothetical protein RQP46_009132 [Phenoliferia psychrophenolica]
MNLAAVDVPAPYFTPPHGGASPVSTLPKEVLALVFDYLYMAGCHPSQRLARYACRQWRKLGVTASERFLSIIYHEDEGLPWLAHVARTRSAGEKVSVNSLYLQDIKEVPEELETLQGVRTLTLANFKLGVGDAGLAELAHPAFSDLSTLVLPNVYSDSRRAAPTSDSSPAQLPPIRRLVLGRLEGGEGLLVTPLLFPTVRELVLYSPHITAHDVVLSPDTTPNLAHLTCLVWACPIFTKTTLACPTLETLEVIVTGLEAPADLASSLANWTEMPGWPASSALKRFILVTKRDAVLPEAELAALRASLELADIEIDHIENDSLLIPDCEAPHFDMKDMAKAPTFGADMGYDSDDSGDKYIYYASKMGLDGFGDW